MCSINAILFTIFFQDDQPIKRMIRQTLHRGPDTSHFRKTIIGENTYYVGANRLRIIDQNLASDQPYEDGINQLIYNGEIYNHHELRNELIRRGIRFKTSSDTEVLFQWLLAYGEDRLEDVKGMFAFVFFNSVENHILAGRDRHGMKPLYYFHDREKIIFSSEIQGILSSGIINKEINVAQITHFLNYKYIKNPDTFYKGIMALGPGDYIKYSIKDNNVEQGTFISLPKYEYCYTSDHKLVDDVEEGLIDSMIRHTRASVPVGLLLSGGVDSTLLLAIASRHKIIDLDTFSIVNRKEDRNFGTDDDYYSTQAAKLYKSNHNIVNIDHTLLKGFDDFVDQMDQPVADNGAWMTWLISGKARDKVGVVLSGAGADEYFGGYNRHIAFNWYLRNHAFFNFLIPASSFLQSLLQVGTNHNRRKKIQLYRKFLSSLDRDPEITYDNFLRLFDRRIPYDYIKTWPKFQGRDFIIKNLQNAFSRDRKEYLVSDVLEISDRMSMRHGLEMRMPYLDDNLASMMLSINSDLVLHHGQKWVLKRLLVKYGGKKFTTRKKEGFGMPFGKWIQMPEYESLWKHYLQPERIVFNWINHQLISDIFNLHFKKKTDYTLEIWAFMVLSAWLEKEWA